MYGFLHIYLEILILLNIAQKITKFAQKEPRFKLSAKLQARWTLESSRLNIKFKACVVVFLSLI